MIVNRGKLIQKLKKVFPLNLAEDDQLIKLAGKTDVVFFKAGDMVFMEEAGARYLYIVFEGEVEILKEENQEIRIKNHLYEGDMFGEDVFLDSHTRQTGARALTDCLLVRIGLGTVVRFFQSNPELSASIKPLVRSYQILQKNKSDFDLGGEVIRYIGQPHKIFLILKSAGLMILTLLVSVGVLLLSANSFLPVVAARWLAAIFSGSYLVWLIWNFFEWANDLYIFTDRRVINQERSVLLYESRQETPLDAIISLSSQMNILGRYYHFGHLFIKTFTGSFQLKNIPLIRETQKYLEFLIEKNRQQVFKEQKNNFENIVRDRMGMETHPKHDDQGIDDPGDQEDAVHESRGGILSRLLGLKQSRGVDVIYRTHWAFLVRKTFIPFAILLSLTLIFINMSMNNTEMLSNSIVAGFFTFSAIIIMIWWLYQFQDWRNDRYIITPDQIIDVYRKPLGLEDKRVAPLENIQSIRYKRQGLLGLALNFGTVFIKIGSEDFTFDHVPNPLEVQQTLYDYLERANLGDKKASLVEQQQQIADWMDAYQRVSREGRRTDQGDKLDNLE